MGKSRRRAQSGNVIAEFPVPDFTDLRSSLHFLPEEAQIWFDGRRMVLIDNAALGIMRRELVAAVGLERARAIMTRMGYEIGASEVHLALRVRKNKSFYEAFSAGPNIHGLKGLVKAEPVVFDVDVEKGRFYTEYYWHNSSECETHLHHMGVGHIPGGWSQIGYASGYATAFIGRPIVYRELQCIAMGHERCLVVGKPVEEWANPEAEERYVRAENYIVKRDPADTREREPGSSPDEMSAPRSYGVMVGASAGFNVALHLLDKVASTTATVLFQGESGVGKEVFARELHRRSARADRPLIAVNCAAIPDTLIESELFGVEKGAYTGAVASRAGRFERAHGGTLFLDEIGSLSQPSQGKLLRALQEGQFERIGGTKTITVDVRVVAATNTDLRAAVETGAFREDLFHRLNVFPIRIPPLRERRADIPLLVNHFLHFFAKRHARSVTAFTERAIHHFLTYDWPGNIRELENLIERGVIVADDDAPVDLHHLITNADHIERSVFEGGQEAGDPFRQFAQRLAKNTPADTPAAVGERLLDQGLSMKQVSDSLIQAAIERTSGNISAAAHLTGLSRSQIYYWLRQKRAPDTEE